MWLIRSELQPCVLRAAHYDPGMDPESCLSGPENTCRKNKPVPGTPYLVLQKYIITLTNSFPESFEVRRRGDQC